MSLKMISLCFVMFLIGQACHYSCATCALDYYNYCIQCEGGGSIDVVENPAEVPSDFLNSNSVTGVCEGKLFTGVNALGIAVVVVGVLSLMITRAKTTFYMVLTLQNIALLSFMEIAWLWPISYIMDGMQYLLVFNVMGEGLKASSVDFIKLSFYRLNGYFFESSILKSMCIVGIFSAVLWVGIVLIMVMRKCMQRCCDGCCGPACQGRLAVLQQWLYVMFFLCIEEAVLSIVVAFKFSSDVTMEMIVILVVYALMVLFFIVESTITQIDLFPNRFNQICNLLKKITYPALLVIGQSYQFILLGLMFSLWVLELVVERVDSEYPVKSRLFVWKITEGIVVLFGGICCIVELLVNERMTTLIIQYVFIVFWCLYVLQLIINTIFRLVQKKEGKGKVIPAESSTSNLKSKQNNTSKMELTEQNLAKQIKVDYKKGQLGWNLDKIQELVSRQREEQQRNNQNVQMRMNKRQSPEQKNRYRPSRKKKQKMEEVTVLERVYGIKT